MTATPRSAGRTLALVAAVLIALFATPATAMAATTTGPQGDPAWVRVAHLVPDLPTMDIWLTPFDGATDAAPALQTSADYGRVKAYAPLQTGLFAISVRPAGMSPDTAPLLSGTFRAEAGKAYTVASLGTAADARIEILEDDLSTPDAGQSRVRLLPAASSTETVTVSAVGGPTLATDAAYAEASGYAQVPAGPWKLDVTPAMSSQIAESITNLNLVAGGVYTLLVLDAGAGLEIRQITDAAGTAVTPVGGAQTGAGGLATASATDPTTTGVLALLALGGLAAAALLVRYRFTPRSA